jgi:hypothetical protein
MRRDICRRIERLEQQAGISAVPNIFLCLVDGGDQAESDGLTWQREPGEVQTDFETRIIADLTSAVPNHNVRLTHCR